jgi:hypothetical protein
MGDAQRTFAAGQAQVEQVVVRVVADHHAFEHHAGILALGQRQVQAGQGLADRAAGQALPCSSSTRWSARRATSSWAWLT